MLNFTLGNILNSTLGIFILTDNTHVRLCMAGIKLDKVIQIVIDNWTNTKQHSFYILMLLQLSVKLSFHAYTH